MPVNIDGPKSGLLPERILVPEDPGMRVLLVHWTDAESRSGYMDRGNSYAVGLENSEVGWLVAESDTWVVLATEYCHGADIPAFRRCISIPRVNITRVVELVESPVTPEATGTSNTKDPEIALPPLATSHLKNLPLVEAPDPGSLPF